MTTDSKISLDSNLEMNSKLCYMSSRICRAVLPLFVSHKILGKENIPKDEPAILASKHTYWFDLVTTCCYIDRMIYTFAKSAYFDTSTNLKKARRWWLKKMGAFNIDRRHDKFGMMRSHIHLMLQPINRGSLLLLYPEGTRVEGTVGRFHKGLAATMRVQAETASRTRLPVIPLSPAYSQKPFGSFESFIPFWRRIKIALVVGEPIYYNGETIREFTGILKERITECYHTAGNLILT